MGRGIPHYDEPYIAVMVDNYDYEEGTSDWEHQDLYEDWKLHLQYSMMHADKRLTAADNRTFCEIEGQNHLVLLESERYNVYLYGEDCYTMIVFSPNKKARWVRPKEIDALMDKYPGTETTGYTYHHDKRGELYEILVPYKVRPDIYKTMRAFLKVYGVLSESKQMYRNVRVRDTSWTSTPCTIHMFKGR